MNADDRIRREAIGWYSRLASGQASAADHAAWASWHAADAAHRQAWDKLERLRANLQALPPQALPTLQARPAAGRRRVLRGLLLATAGSGAAWLAWQEGNGAALLAQHRTATGQRLTLELDDGSRLVLNTGSAVDVRFDASRRLLHLHAGEIMLETAAARAADADADANIDATSNTASHTRSSTRVTANTIANANAGANARRQDSRPLLVTTAHGSVRALGTRFSVRTSGERTLVSVFQHAVELRPQESGKALQLQAGQQLAFNRQGASAASRVDADAAAWVDGSLVVNDAPLGEVVAELARYRSGHLGCDDAVAGLRVSGAFPLDDTERALAVLAKSLPVRVRRTTRFWVSVGKA